MSTKQAGQHSGNRARLLTMAMIAIIAFIAISSIITLDSLPDSKLLDIYSSDITPVLTTGLLRLVMIGFSIVGIISAITLAIGLLFLGPQLLRGTPLATVLALVTLLSGIFVTPILSPLSSQRQEEQNRANNTIRIYPLVSREFKDRMDSLTSQISRGSKTTTHTPSTPGTGNNTYDVLYRLDWLMDRLPVHIYSRVVELHLSLKELEKHNGGNNEQLLAQLEKSRSTLKDLDSFFVTHFLPEIKCSPSKPMLALMRTMRLELPTENNNDEKCCKQPTPTPSE